MPNLQNIVKVTVARARQLSWIDLLGICLFLGILSVAFFFFLRKAEYAYITMRISQSDNFDTSFAQAPIWYVEKIQPGLKETDGLGRDSVVVERVHRFRSSDLNQNLYADLKVKAVYNSRTGQYSYNGSPLLVGSFQSFKLQNVQLYGTIVGIRGKDEVPEEKTFIVKGYVDSLQNDNQASIADTVVDGIRHYLADTIQKGMTIMDVDGKVIAEITDVRKFDGKRQFVSGGNFITIPDPDRKRVEMTMEVKTVKINDAYYYKQETPLLVNTVLYLTLPQSNINFTITEVTEKTTE